MLIRFLKTVQDIKQTTVVKVIVLYIIFILRVLIIFHKSLYIKFVKMSFQSIGTCVLYLMVSRFIVEICNNPPSSRL